MWYIVQNNHKCCNTSAQWSKSVLHLTFVAVQFDLPVSPGVFILSVLRSMTCTANKFSGGEVGHLPSRVGENHKTPL